MNLVRFLYILHTNTSVENEYIYRQKDETKLSSKTKTGEQDSPYKSEVMKRSLTNIKGVIY